MKNVVFLISHLGSGSDALSNILNRNPRVWMTKTGESYIHPLDLVNLTDLLHKAETSASYWGDHLLFNHQIGHKAFYEICKFIYMMRPARAALNEMQGYEPFYAMRYYCYRLRRMWDMFKKTPNAILITYDEMTSGKVFPEIEDYLGLAEPLSPELPAPEQEDLMPPEIVQEAQDCYERYFYLMNQARDHEGCIPK